MERKLLREGYPLLIFHITGRNPDHVVSFCFINFNSDGPDSKKPGLSGLLCNEMPAGMSDPEWAKERKRRDLQDWNR